jgi:hypothetical protein
MRNHRLFVVLFVVSLLLVNLFIGSKQVRAYGNLTYTINCPVLRFTGTSDNPQYNAIARVHYVMAFFRNQTTGLAIDTSARIVRTERVVTPVSSYILYYFDETWNMTGHLHPGDVFSITLFDNTAVIGGYSGTCGTSSGSTIPSGYRLMTVVCAANILSSPAGPVLPSYPRMPEVGKRRYVLLIGAVGSDGQLYDKMQAASSALGYFPRRCLAE